MDVVQAQLAVCRKFGSPHVAAREDLMVGISLTVRDGLLPINGLRHPLVANTTGWFIWAGEELSDAPGFLKPSHVSHLPELCPLAVKYLGLAPGWRFLVTPT